MGPRFRLNGIAQGIDGISILMGLGTKNLNQVTEIIDSDTSAQLYFIP